MRFLHRPRRLVPILVLALASAIAVPAAAQTKGDVNRAEDAKEQAYAALVAADAELEDALEVLERIYSRIQILEWDVSRLTKRVAEFEAEVDGLRESAKEVVVEAYVSGGVGLVTAALAADSIQDLLTSQVLIDNAASRDTASLNRLASVGREMERLKLELGEREAEEETLRAEQANAVADFDSIRERAAQIFADAARKHADVLARYKAEQARRAAAAAAAKRGAARGLPITVTQGTACPIPGGSYFIDSWGAPRSGGRSHKGVDMMAGRGARLDAMWSGSVRLNSHYLGGIQVYLYGDNGIMYYYAHLSGYAPGLSSGARVQRGQHIGYVGDTGNARGTPHLHLGMGPIGGGLVNPYPTVRAAC